MKSAIYAGSFDPIHFGHLDIIKRASKLTDKLYVGVLENSTKVGLLTLEEKISVVKEVTKDLENVEVVSFGGLLFEYVKNNNIDAIVKGLRNAQDFQYEYNLANGIKVVEKDVETIALISSVDYSYLSSSLVRDFAHYSKDLSMYVPKEVCDVLNNKIRR